MRRDNYMDVLEHHLLPFWPIHEKQIQTIDWPGSSPDLNPIENAWNFMKNKVQEKQPSSIPELKIVLRDLWVHMDIDYFTHLSDSMPNRLRKVIEAKGQMTKY